MSLFFLPLLSLRLRQKSASWLQHPSQRIVTLEIEGDDHSTQMSSGRRVEHRNIEVRWRRLRMMNRIGGDPNVGVAIVRQYGVAAVRIADAAREIAARDVDLDAMTGW